MKWCLTVHPKLNCQPIISFKSGRCCAKSSKGLHQWQRGKPASSRKNPVLNPATEGTIGSIYFADAADVDTAVAATQEAFISFSQSSKEQRLALLEQLMIATKARVEDLVLAMSQEMGTPLVWLEQRRLMRLWDICKDL